MFDEIRDWNRENIEEYVEVFLDVPMSVLQKRDRKGLYSEYKEGKKTDIAGVDVQIQFPKHPDIIIQNDGSVPVEECVQRIREYQVKSSRENAKDVDYWNQFYSSNSDTVPSKFAHEIFEKMQPGGSVLELGCGNGRDSAFFAKQGMKVTAIDYSKVAISKLKQNNPYKVDYICDDFVESRTIFQRQFDYIYSRFTLHILTQKQEEELLDNISLSLKKDGLLFIEARTIHDSMFGQGETLGKNAFIIREHYHRYIDRVELEEALMKRDFQILYSCESADFSPTENEAPSLLRIIALNKNCIK